LMPKHGLTLVEAAAPRTVDISSAASRLAGQVDVIYTSTDNNVISAYEALVKVGNETNTPLIAADTDSVKRGAVAALGLNYLDLGRQTGEVVVRILNGEAPGTIASQRSDNLDLFVNLKAAELQGVTVPEEVIKAAAEVIR
nr:ABC transporter substrate-binding protein [Pseudomonas sp.]